MVLASVLMALVAITLLVMATMTIVLLDARVGAFASDELEARSVAMAGVTLLTDLWFEEARAGRLPERMALPSFPAGIVRREPDAFVSIYRVEASQRAEIEVEAVAGVARVRMGVRLQHP